MPEQHVKKNRGRVIGTILLILLLLLLFLIWGGRGHPGGRAAPAAGGTVGATAADTAAAMAAAAGAAPVATTESDTGAGRSKAAPARTRAVIAGPSAAHTADSGSRTASDSAGSDTTTASADACSRDTLTPWVYPDPSGGLHRKVVSVHLVPNKPCTIEWRHTDNEPWQLYDGGAIPVTSTATLEYRANDSCGRSMEQRTESYEIDLTDVRKLCPNDMELVKVGSNRFCIDRYEWPNRKGVRPQAYVSIYQATDSCFSAGKRLCSTDEWSMACRGPYGWSYPYGGTYEPRACVTKDTAVHLTGSKPECRGYFEVYDMAGNLAEWTSTPAQANPAFYNVMGGFWQSGSQSGCNDARYSYFPQNKHNPVGFRCCKDAAVTDKH